MDPGTDSSSGVFECGSKLTDHQCVWHEIEREHQDPAEDNLQTVEVNETIQYVTETPYGGESHKGQVIPKNLLCLHSNLLFCALSVRIITQLCVIVKQYRMNALPHKKLPDIFCKLYTE